MNRLKVTPSEFQALSQYIYAVSGITLAAGKEYLIETRLGQLAAEYGCSSYQDLLSRARSGGELEHRIVDAISTNETYFFRDNAPFDLLQHKIIPDILDRKGKQGRPSLKIWSCACSTGQEIYSTAIILRELGLHHGRCDLKLMATDISDAAISRASYGLYTSFEASRGLSEARRNRHFTPQGEGYRINDEIRAMVSFQKLNLLKPRPGIGTFDIILCRNVAIYFNRDDRLRLFENLSKHLSEDGALLIGSTESLSQDETPFEPQRYLNATFYNKRGQAPSESSFFARRAHG